MEKAKEQTKAPPPPPQDNINTDSVYDFYTQQLYPSICASLPFLASRLRQDVSLFLTGAWTGFLAFLLPKGWATATCTADDDTCSSTDHTNFLSNLPQLWQEHYEYLNKLGQKQQPDFMLRYFDSNGDGHISSKELLNMTELWKTMQYPTPTSPSWWVWFSREWPLMDWKVGVFLWQTFGGILLVLTVVSIIPGRLHGMAARILRWPILGLTYFLISVELMYVVQYGRC
jgi:hypothetical protein